MSNNKLIKSQKKETIHFSIMGEYIELIKLLKVTGLSDTGGEAKAMVEGARVTLNGQPESRKRAKIRKGDKVEIHSHIIIVE